MKILIPFLWILLLFGCQNQTQSLSPKAYEAYCKDSTNGLVNEVSVGAINYSLRYLPNTYQALKNLNFVVKDSLQLKEAMASTEGHHYLHLKIENTQNNASLAKFLPAGENWTSVKTTLLFHTQKEFKLKVNGMQLPCKLYHGFPLKNDQRMDFMMVFQSAEVTTNFDESLVFEFNDTHFSKTVVQIPIDNNALNNIPTLKI